jgi:hypothetical protein
MRKISFLLFSIVIAAIFITNFAKSYSQNTVDVKKEHKCSQEAVKEHNCSKEAVKEHNCSKEVKASCNKVEEKSTKCEGETFNVKVPEIEKLHTPVAQLWHKDFPALNLKRMKKSTDKMIKILPKFDNLKLPKEFASKESEFRKAVADFKISVMNLKSYLSTLKEATEQDSDLKNKVVKMHTDFHTLSEVIN